MSERDAGRPAAEIEQSSTTDELPIAPAMSPALAAAGIGRRSGLIGGRVIFVELDRIDWVEAEGNYARLHLGPESHLIRETMNALAARLGSERFFRIHRSRIVNIARIKELRLAPGGDYDVVLDTGIRLGLSRLQRASLQARLASAVRRD